MTLAGAAAATALALAAAFAVDPGFTAVHRYEAHLSGHVAPDTIIVERRCSSAACERNGVVYVRKLAAPGYTRAGSGAALGAFARAIPHGQLVHLAPHADAIRAAIAGPFVCDECRPNVPVLIVVTHGALADSLWQHPTLLRRDAASAWSNLARLRAAGALRGLFTDARVRAYAEMFRYLADECRLRVCADGFRNVEAVYHGRGSEQTLLRIHRFLVFDGFYR